MNNKKMSETEKVVDTENSFLGIQHVLLAVKKSYWELGSSNHRSAIYLFLIIHWNGQVIKTVSSDRNFIKSDYSVWITTPKSWSY